MPDPNWQPRIVAFFCNWCTYTAADLAGVSRLKYAPNVRVIRLMCSGRVDPQFILDALARGADGVLIGGCHLGDCHYVEGNYKTMRRFRMLKRMLADMGVEDQRVRLEWISASEGERIKTVVLPVYGYGLWSTMYGLIALAGDGRTVTGLTFYEHGETPGLGDFIGSPAWQAQFPGKLAFDEQGKLRLGVIKGGVNPASPEARYQVDAVAGATLTSNGVNNLLRYWLGEQGFGPFLGRLQAGGEKS